MYNFYEKTFCEIHRERAVGIKFDPVLADFITLYLLFSMNRPYFFNFLPLPIKRTDSITIGFAIFENYFLQ